MAKTMYQDGQRHLPDAAHLSLNTLPLDRLPTAVSLHSDPGLACSIAAFCPLPFKPLQILPRTLRDLANGPLDPAKLLLNL